MSVEPEVRAVTPILNVSDVRAGIAWFTQLGWATTFVWDGGDGTGEPSFAGVTSGHAEIFLCRDGQGARGADGAWMSWFLGSAEEVDVLHAKAVELGLDVTMPPTNEPWGVREFHLRHPDGHTFRVGAGYREPSAREHPA